MNTVPGDCSTVFHRVLAASFLLFFHLELLYSPGMDEPTNSKADPVQTETPHSTQKSEPQGRKEDPLPADRINSLEVRGPPRPDQRSAYKENISL